MKSMRRTNQPSQAIMGRPGACLTAVVFVMASAGSVNAQQKMQTETQLELPAEQTKAIDKEQIDREKLEQEKTDNDDKAGTASPDRLKKNKLPAVQKDKLPAEQQDKLPAVQKDKLPAVQQDRLPAEPRDKLPTVQQDRLPAVQKDKLPAVQQDRLPEAQRDKLPAVQEPHPISDDPADAPYADSDALPDGAGTPDTGGFVAEPPSIDKAELAIITGPTWRWDGGTRSAGSVLYYGHRYEVSFVVKNLGDQPARYRPKYEIGGLIGFSERTIEPGETQHITWDVQFGPSSHSTEIRRQIMEDERIDTRVFLAEADPGAGVYADSDISNNVSRRSWDVRRRLRLHVQLQRLNQYAHCDRWVRDRDWRFWTYLLGTEEGRAHIASLDGNPAFLDDSVTAGMSLGPLGYRSLVKPGADEVGFSVRVFGLKDDGSIKNSGRTAVFSMTHSLRSLMAGRVNREIRSTESGGSFCGEGNLGLDVLMYLSLAPYE